MANYLNGMGVYKNAFNANDGTLKKNLVVKDINAQAVSNNVRAISGALSYKPITSQETVSDGAKEAKSVIEKVIGERASVVITNDSTQNRAFYNPSEGVIYINNKANLSGEDVAKFVAVHEITHTTEGTEYYDELEEVLVDISKDASAPQALKDKIGDLKERQGKIARKYEDQLKNQNALQQIYTVETERNADLIGELLGNDYYINKLANRNLPLLKKLYLKIKGLMQKSADTDSASAKYLNKLASKFAKAIDHSQGGVKISQLGPNEDEEKEKAKNTDTGIRFSKGINEYPYIMQKVIDGYINSVDQQLLNQAEKQRKNKNAPFERLKICDVDDEFVDEVSSLYGMNVSDFTVNINSNAFNHIENRHGLNGEADKSMANLKDVARIGFVIENRDSLEPLTNNGKQVYSAEFRTKQGTPAPMMFIKKKINGTYYCAIAVTDAKYKKVWVQTAFINKRDGLTQILHDEISSLSLTSETVTASHPSNSSISEKTENVNDFDENNDVRYSKASSEPEFVEAEDGVRIDFGNPREYMEDLIESEPDTQRYRASEQARQESEESLLNSKEGKLEIETRYEGDIVTDEERLAMSEAQAKQRLEELTARDKFAGNKNKVLKMESVFAVTGEEFAKGELDLVTQVDEYFKTFNYRVYNKEVGKVLIDKRGIKDDIAHGIGRKKAATFAAVPDVIKNGKVVDYQKNWKGRGYDTAVIAAPITIANEKHYMGVVVIQNKENNRFYVHEVATIKEEGAQPFKTSLAENNSNAGGDTPSIISILQNLAKNNPSYEKNSIYTKKGAVRSLVLQAIDSLFNDGKSDDVAFILNDAKNDIVSAIWKKINSTKEYNKKSFSDYIAKKIMQSIILGDGSVYKTEAKLKSIMHRIDLSSVEERIGKREKLKISSRWKLKEGKEAISIEDAVKDLNDLGYQIPMTDELDMLNEINRVYENTREYIDKEMGERLSERMGKEEYEKAKKKIADDIFEEFEKNQTDDELASKLAYVTEKYQKELKKHREYRKEFKQDENRVRAELAIIHQAIEIKRDIKNHTYTKAQQPKFNEFKNIIPKIGKLEYRGNINLSSTKEIVADLSPWYTKDNPVLQNFSAISEDESKNIGFFSKDIRGLLDYFSEENNVQEQQNNGKTKREELSYSELQLVNIILAHMNHIFDNYGKIYKHGRRVEADSVAREMYDVMVDAEKNQSLFERTN